MQRSAAAFTVFLLLAQPSFSARRPGDPLTPGFNVMSKQQDIQLGQEAAAQVRQKYQVVQNQFLQDYIKRVGDRLASSDQARSSGFPFTFTLIVDPSINAFALPGGPMFINSGLLQNVDTEGELAGVMAHEMSHVILRHGTHQMSKSNAISLPAALAGAVLGGSGSVLGQLASAGIGLGANSLILKYSRDAESEADALGARLMAEGGWNPQDLATFFEKLESQGGQRIQILSDHPNPGNRRAAIEAEIRTFPRSTYNFNTGEFSRAKAEAAGLPRAAVAGRNAGSMPPPQTSAPGGAPQTFNGQSFTMQYPTGWQAYGGDQANGATFAPRNGIVAGANGTNQVGLGAIASYFFPDGDKIDLPNATNDLVHHLHQGNPNLQVIGRQRQMTVGGRKALVTTMESGSPFGGAETDALVTVATPDGLFYLVFIAPQQQFQQLEGAFNQMIGSIRFK